MGIKGTLIDGDRREVSFSGETATPWMEEERRSRSMFLGRRVGVTGNLTNWMQEGQRMVEGKGLGMCAIQDSQVEWPQERTRGTAAMESYGAKQTGHSGGSTASMVEACPVAALTVEFR